MLDNKKEYDLFEALNNSNAEITFAQLFAVSPLLRRLCIKGLKLNPKDIRKINSVHHTNLDENDSDFLINVFKNIYTDYKSTTPVSEKVVELNLNDLSTKRINLINKANIATVIGSIDKHVVKVLVDTGAEVNIINKPFFELNTKNHKVHILERNYFKVPGKNMTSTNQVINLSLKFENLVINAPFYILDDDDPSYDIIIGRQVHKDYRLFVYPDDDALYMKTDTNPVLVAYPTDITTSNRLFRISIYSNPDEFPTYSELPDGGIELSDIDNIKLK